MDIDFLQLSTMTHLTIPVFFQCGVKILGRAGLNVIPRPYNSLLNVAAKTFEFMLQSTLHLGM